MLASTIRRGTSNIIMRGITVLVSTFVDKRQSDFRVILNRGSTVPLGNLMHNTGLVNDSSFNILAKGQIV
jgi:hypothetical protein